MDVFDYLSGVSPPRYKKPTSGDAKCIWEQIGFEESETEEYIIHTLHIWAQTNNYLHLKDNCVYIHWTSPTNVTLVSKWQTFMRWFILNCSI